MSDTHARLKAKASEVKSRHQPGRSLPVIRAACPDLGERVPGQPCGSPLLRCNRHGDVTTRITPCAGAQRCCATCDDHPRAKAPAARPGWLLVPQPPALELTPTRPRAVVTVVTGPEAQACFATSGPLLRAYADRLGADFVALEWRGHPAWPMSSKFAIARTLEHYDRIAYVDADVLLRPGCIDLFAACGADEFGICDELPFHRQNPRFGRERAYQRFRADMGFKGRTHLPWYGNAGVMVVPRSHRELLLPPTTPMPTGHCCEQDLTNSRLLDSGLPYRLLDRRANWQNWTDPAFAAAPRDAILHWSGAGGGRRNRAAEMARAARA